MTNISDEYIAEAALGDAYGNPRREKEENAFIRFINSGWGVAMICAIVSLIAVVAMVKWGQMGDPVDPVGPSGSPSKEFGFTYEMPDSNISSLTCAAMPGATVQVNASVINHGAPFYYTGAASEYRPHAQFILQTDPSVILYGYLPHTCDMAEYLVETGEKGMGCYLFTIPEDAPTGVYDLELSYGDESYTFDSVLIITPTKIPFPDLSNHRISFYASYNTTGGLHPGDVLNIFASICNEGEAFTYVGDPFDFKPEATLYHMEDPSYTVKGFPAPTGMEPRICTVEHGDLGNANYDFYIPQDAPTGSYGLILSYGGHSQISEDYVTVEPPAEQAPPFEPPVPDDATAELLRDAYVKLHSSYISREGISIRRYYGVLPSGAVVAMLDSTDILVSANLWSERVGAANIKYTDGNRILVLHNGVFYTLPEARTHSGGILTQEDLMVIEALHRQYYPFLYKESADGS